MLLGLIPTVSIFPTLTLPTGLVGLTLLLPVALWGRFQFGLPHLFISLFLAYAATSAIWTVGSVFDGGWMLLCFVIGLIFGLSRDQRPIWIGIAIGLTISSGFAIAQSQGLGWPTSARAGLYINESLHGWVLALAIIGLVCNRLWYLSFPLLPGLYISNSRAGIGLLIIGLIATVVRRPVVIFTIVIVGTALMLDFQNTNDIQRVEIWRYSLALIVPLGHGIGSFMELYYHDATRIWQAYAAHNDYIQLVFEYGIGSLPLFGTWLWMALQSKHDLWPLHIACCILALFAFPFYTPITAFIWALACGGIMRISNGTQGSV